jgi:hypothetical protein
MQWDVSGKSTNTGSCSKSTVTSYNWSVNNNQKYAFNPTFDFSSGGGSGGGGTGGPSQPGNNREVIKLLTYNDPGELYKLLSVCETDSGGNPVSSKVEALVPAGTRSIAESVNLRIDGIVKLLQGLKDFKQPVCPTTPTYQPGDVVTVNFESWESTPSGHDVLRKTLSYFDRSNRDVTFHGAHWDGFTWQTGRVRVKLVQSPIGFGEVWARTEEEGKRVLNHAALASGVTLTPENTIFRVFASTSTRMGVEMTVGVKHFSQNTISVSKRKGSAGPPQYPVAR